MQIYRVMLCLMLLRYTTTSSSTDVEIEPDTLLFYIYALISLGLSCFAGVCSGLTVGYMSISKNEMELKLNSGSEADRQIAKPILALLNNHHMLLSTLLLSNSLALEALPIFLDKIVPSYLAIVISTAAVVVFGEVIPQAYCTGKYNIPIGRFFAPFVAALQFIFYIFVWPITYVLDNWLGHQDDKLDLDAQNLKNLLFLHDNREYGYRPEQIRMLQNTIDLRLKIVQTRMIPLKDLFMVDQLTSFDTSLLGAIRKSPFSKIIVYSGQPSKAFGYLKLKNLLAVKINQSSVKSSGLVKEAPRISMKATLLQAVEILKEKTASFAIVHSEDGSCVGAITLARIFEEMMMKSPNAPEFKWEDVEAAEQD